MIVENEDLRKYTTIRIGGRAKYFCSAKNPEDIKKAILLSKERDIPLFILGNGSNTIFGNVNGIVLHTGLLKGISVEEKNGKLLIRAKAGERLSEIIKITVKENVRDFYKLYGFPASVGGAVCMNAGSFGAEIKDFLHEITYMNWEGEIIRERAENLKFSYRNSEFPKKGIVLEATFIFEKETEKNIKEELKRIIQERKSKQPINKPTSGSTFKNPEGNYAGRLLEMVKMKGFRVGDVAFSEKHANFLINLGNGSFEEVREIIEEAKRRVFEEFGILLEEEVRLVESSGLNGWKIL